MQPLLLYVEYAIQSTRQLYRSLHSVNQLYGITVSLWRRPITMYGGTPCEAANAEMTSISNAFAFTKFL